MNIFNYILDANVFIEAARRYYSFDFGTKFWNFLIEKFNNNILCSIDKVLEEIKRGYEKDRLREWAEKNNYIFLSTKNIDTIKEYAEIINWAENEMQYTRTAKDEFMKADNADAWVIAFGKANNLIVVTNEILDSRIKRRIPIPNVCQNLNVPYIDTFEFLRRENFRL